MLYSLPFRLMVVLWNCVALILLFLEAIHGQARTGYILFCLQFRFYITILQFIFPRNVFFLSIFLSFSFLPTEVYTFESASHLSDFTASSTSTIARSTTRYKDATHSLKWTWASGDSITHSFTSNVSNTFLHKICVFIILEFHKYT